VQLITVSQGEGKLSTGHSPPVSPVRRRAKPNLWFRLYSEFADAPRCAMYAEPSILGGREFVG
jgi:hypothetical protein